MLFQLQPRWPACEATAYRRRTAPAPDATQLGLYGGRDARFGGKQSRAERQARQVVFVQSGHANKAAARARLSREGEAVNLAPAVTSAGGYDREKRCLLGWRAALGDELSRTGPARHAAIHPPERSTPLPTEWHLAPAANGAQFSRRLGQR
jgi:hypothetical protein